MKRNMKKNMANMLATGLTLFFAGQAQAIGTADDKTISNTASVTFTIGGNTPPAVESEEVTFEVDTLIRPVVTSGGNANVVAGVNDFVLPFTVTNESNRAGGSDFFVLSTEETASASITMNNVEIYEDVNKNGTYEPLTDTLVGVTVSISNADVSNSKQFLIVADTPVSNGVGDATDTAEPGNTVTYSLIATAVENAAGDALTGTETPLTDANDPNAHETILFDDAGTATVDAQYDAKHSASGVYTTLATLDISKTASDGSSNYHLPGDTVTYTITVTNTDPGLPAKSVVVIDSIPEFTTYESFEAGDCPGTRAWSTAVSPAAPGDWLTPEPNSQVTKDAVKHIRCTFTNDIAINGGTGAMTFKVKIN